MHNVIYAATKGTDMYAEHGVAVPTKPVALTLADHFHNAGQPDTFMPFGYGAFDAFGSILKDQHKGFSDKALSVATEFGTYKLEIRHQHRNLLPIMDKLFGRSQLEQNLSVQEQGSGMVVSPQPSAKRA